MLPSLIDELKIDIYASRDRDEVSILFDKPLRDLVDHLELETASGELTFIYRNGQQQSFGEPISPPIIEKLQKTELVGLFIIQTHNKKVETFGAVRVVVID